MSDIREIPGEDVGVSGASFGNVYLQGAFQIGSGSSQVGFTNLAGTVVLYAGSATPASAPFRVYEDGSVVLTDLLATGYIASSRRIADGDSFTVYNSQFLLVPGWFEVLGSGALSLFGDSTLQVI